MKMAKEEQKNNKRQINRPPIVVVMGHIDHGKSKLLDYIRKSNVVEKEAGGITQHIGAYEAEINGKKITFLDTPGHEAFSKIRSRGAKAADIAVLVVAADEGPKPQTIEAYKIIEEAKIPFIIALNKIDKPEANPEMAKSKLAEHQIFVEGYGGNIPAVEISALTGKGVNELLELILLLAEMENLTANPDENASGIVIESHLDPKRGITATLIIQNGTMKKGMFVLAKEALAPVRIFEDFQGRPIEEATFSSPVRIVGFDKLPEAGENFETFSSREEAEEARKEREKLKAGAAEKRKEELPKQENLIVIPVVIKADTLGTLDALEKEIKKVEGEKALVEIIKSGVGNINEEDVKFAVGSEDAVFLGFNVKIEAPAKNLLEKQGGKLFISDIIYEISGYLRKEIEKRIAKEAIKQKVGTAEILKIFSGSKNKYLVGGKVLEGKIILRSFFKILRNEEKVGEGRIMSLQHNKIDAAEVDEDKEFGAMVEIKGEIQEGDKIEVLEK